MRILCLLPALALAGPWPNGTTFPESCDATRTGWSQTRCEAGHTCCASQFSGSGVGCCPFEDAVCCANKLTCCPRGTRCEDTVQPGWPSWGAVTSCVPSVPGSSNNTGASTAVNTTGACVCKPGPKLPMSATVPNVLIIGDSVSIGYTPFVAKALGAATALVQHAPSGGDGGAEETAYGVQCLDYFLRAPNGSAYAADVIMFNWGLHDGPQLFDQPPANVTIPGQEGSMKPYAAELENITLRLLDRQRAVGGKLLFAITSPMLCNERADQDVSWLNVQAKAIMAKHGVATVDLHQAVTTKCGAVPQASCFGAEECFCPHCAGIVYEFLANSTIAPAIRQLLAA